jgi:hypothetical protein
MQLIDKEKKNPYDNCEPAHPLHSGKWAVSYIYSMFGPLLERNILIKQVEYEND